MIVVASLGIVVFSIGLGAALVILVIVACSSTDYREVRLAIGAVVVVLAMLGAEVAGVTHVAWGTP